MRKMMIAACFALSLGGCAGTYADVNRNTQVAVKSVSKTVNSATDAVVTFPKKVGDALTPAPKAADVLPPLK